MTISSYLDAVCDTTGIEGKLKKDAISYAKKDDALKKSPIKSNENLKDTLDANLLKLNAKRLIADYVAAESPDHPAIRILRGT